VIAALNCATKARCCATRMQIQELIFAVHFFAAAMHRSFPSRVLGQTAASVAGTAFLVKDLGQADSGNGFVEDDGGAGTAARMSFVSRMRFG